MTTEKDNPLLAKMREVYKEVQKEQAFNVELVELLKCLRGVLIGDRKYKNEVLWIEEALAKVKSPETFIEQCRRDI